jgi:hypothetical protein
MRNGNYTITGFWKSEIQDYSQSLQAPCLQFGHVHIAKKANADLRDVCETLRKYFQVSQPSLTTQPINKLLPL